MPAGKTLLTATLEEDEVDRVLAAWLRQRPDLDVRPLAVLSRLSRLARHLERIRRASFAAHGLQSAEFDVLAALRRAGHPYQLTPSQLTAAVLVSSATMTCCLTRLHTKNLVRRVENVRDHRGQLVELSDQGLSRVDGALGDLLAAEEKLLAALPAPERDLLTSLLRALLVGFDHPTRAD